MITDFGTELILDLHECDPGTFNRESILGYLVDVCDKIKMERVGLHWWDDLTHPDAEGYEEDHLVGTSVVQFIKTSNITIHSLDILKKLYLNLFSCKDFDAEVVKEFTEQWFKGKVVNQQVVRRM